MITFNGPSQAVKRNSHLELGIGYGDRVSNTHPALGRTARTPHVTHTSMPPRCLDTHFPWLGTLKGQALGPQNVHVLP